MRDKLLFIVAAASLVLSGGTGWGQDGKDCRDKNPSIRGQWMDNELGLAVSVQTGVHLDTGHATGTYVIPQTCQRPRRDGTIVKMDYAFDGIVIFPTLIGTIAVCYFIISDKDHPSGYTTSLDHPDLRLTMSEDGMTLTGDYTAAGATHHVTYTRVTPPQYDFKQWTVVSIAGGTKIYNKPEPGSDVNLTISEKADFQIASTILNKDGDPTWYSVTRAGHPVGVDYGWVPADQVKCKKAPPPAR